MKCSGKCCIKETKNRDVYFFCNNPDENFDDGDCDIDLECLIWNIGPMYSVNRR
jgi:hypothetical protein